MCRLQRKSKGPGNFQGVRKASYEFSVNSTIDPSEQDGTCSLRDCFHLRILNMSQTQTEAQKPSAAPKVEKLGETAPSVNPIEEKILMQELGKWEAEGGRVKVSEEEITEEKKPSLYEKEAPPVRLAPSAGSITEEVKEAPAPLAHEGGHLEKKGESKKEEVIPASSTKQVLQTDVETISK
jgi:hypothetical protein